MTTEYRIIKSVDGHGDDEYSIQEVYLDEDNCLCGHSIDLDVRGKSVEELKEQIKEMTTSFDKQMFFEFRSRVEEI
jgi:hypothetical protein|tara:strand:+ start:543 stop:770 length:228 start_codon:yes stop_codon:yes gene_type:complete